jgi:protein-L-isoaspartate(D-aspartate) O-methyltransferase
MEPLSSHENSSAASALHQALVDTLQRDGSIQTPRVEAAFRAIPRHLFLPGVALGKVYQNEPVATLRRPDGRALSSSSRPAIMALMLEQLRLEPGQRVLEIGTGTGYNAALLAHIVGETGHVTTIDIDQELVDTARLHLAAAHYAHVHTVCGDGGFGHPPHAPYDRIIATTSVGTLPPLWWAQLHAHGRLLVPLSLRGPILIVAFVPAADHLVSVAAQPYGFIPMRGAFAGAAVSIPLGPVPGLWLELADHRAVDAAAVYRWLHGARTLHRTTVSVTLAEFFGGVNLWVVLHENNTCALHASGAVAEQGILPGLLGTTTLGPSYFTSGMRSDSGVCVLTGPPNQPPPRQRWPLHPVSDEQPFELWMCSFGSDLGLAARLMAHLAAWETAGRPTTQKLRIRAYPLQNSYTPTTNEVLLQTAWTQFVLDWQ